MAYLLDTPILSHVIRRPSGAAAQRLARAGAANVRTSIVVAAELRFGAAKGGSRELVRRIEALLERLAVEPFSEPADCHYARLRAHLERAGTPIGGNDLLIAAHALALGDVLVTDNEREFLRVPDLRLENWL